MFSLPLPQLFTHFYSDNGLIRLPRFFLRALCVGIHDEYSIKSFRGLEKKLIMSSRYEVFDYLESIHCNFVRKMWFDIGVHNLIRIIFKKDLPSRAILVLKIQN